MDCDEKTSETEESVSVSVSGNTDTIAAITTPPGRGGVGIVRLSGSDAKRIAAQITRNPSVSDGASALKKSPVANARVLYDQHNNIIDQGVVLSFTNPHSFTGEDVVEFQAHGSPIVLDQLLRTAIFYGARLAEPGEFSKRAFLNKKIDLAQAEAIADLIAANSEQAARSAVRSLQGEFSKKIHALQNSLTTLRIQIEAMIDFPEEEIDFLADPAVATLLQKTIDDLIAVKNTAKQGVLLQSGLRVVIVGKPNAGKSSLLNYLSGRESAIVTNIPGTTRDVLRESIQIDGMPLHIVDTAGLRETHDVVEQEGVRRAYAEMQQADLILHVIDATESDMVAEIKTSVPTIIIRNKIDLCDENPHVENNCISLSIQKNEGMHLLIEEIKKIAGFQSNETDSFIARRRHVDAIERAYQFLMQAQQQLIEYRAGELVAEELRLAQLALSEITGEFSADDLLGRIFSSFCIGK